jgi:sugar-specific transcriptional regulator TrmB
MSINSEKAVKSYLTEFGLNDKEVSIYLTLLKTGPSTIMDLSRKTGIKRSTTHNNVEELIKKGLVSQTNYGERRMAVAEDPEKLKFLLEQRKWDVQKLEKVMPDIVKSIYETIPGAKDNSKVEVKYYEGENGFRDATQRSISESKGEILQISNMTEWRKVFTYDYAKEFYIPLRLKKGIHARTLALKDEVALQTMDEDKALNREMRFLPAGISFKPTIMIYGNEISLMTSSEPYTSIIITNEEIADALRGVFNSLWDLSKGE